ncbi:MAG: plasmid stabilization protein ParE [Novosphingobium sp.]|nr:plasmid stabilization protein ParE [Novosphingobium sp.]MBX9643202.1 type II toxin-antitoxin system RelE/ParE family toxin [Novosphingobium sp.]
MLFELSPEADRDLEDIFDYTARQWGVDQADRYLIELETGVEAFVTGSKHFRHWPEINPRLRSIRCQRHHIFLIEREQRAPLIVAILHEKMDLITRIRARLAPE